MIDWLQVAFNGLWILGCAVVLAAVSHVGWLAHMRGIRVRQLYSVPAFQLSFLVGIGLVCLGLFFLSRTWLEHLIWAALTVLVIYRLFHLR